MVQKDKHIQNYILYLKNFISLLRPYQWIKNLLLFSPLFFSGHIIDTVLFTVAVAAFIFSLVSGLGYVLNDWMDRKNDAYHPDKKKRPFCKGALNGYHALFFCCIILGIIALCLIVLDFPNEFFYFLLTYAGLTTLYSIYLKHIVILEIFVVASGFVIRVLAGGAVCGIAISSWLFSTVFFIAMMISIAKRVNELKELGKGDAIMHRKSQEGYSQTYLNSMLWACGSITLVVYALYAVEQGSLVIYSILPASYGIFRFIYLTDLGRGSDPIRTLFSDRQLLLTTLIFLLVLTFVIYKPC